MKSQCLPFREIPHTTSIYSDFVSDFPKVKQFYSRPPYMEGWLKEEAASVRYEPSRRQTVSQILKRQNQHWGASPKTLENISRLERGAFALVTGQQVGLFGGPLFSIFKALTAVRLAEQATAAGVECVPVFWLATEDHDLAEVNHTSMPGPEASLQILATATAGVAGAPVGPLTFGHEINDTVAAAASLMGDTDATALLRECYRPGETMGSAYARLFARILGDWGVVLLDAADQGLHTVAAPIYRSALERASELGELLMARGKELESEGYHQQVKVTSSSTLLFVLQDGARVPIHRDSNHRDSNHTSGSAGFLIGDEQISAAEFEQRVSSSPQDFSPNVLLRPVIQDFLLPTLAYVGGAAEVAYFAQAGVVYEGLLGRRTPIIPRFSATLIEPKPQALLERYSLAFTDLFQAEALREKLASHILPPDLQTAFDNAGSSLETSLAPIRDALSQLDKTLIEAATNAGSKMQHQLDQLRARAARAELRQSEVLSRHAEFLVNQLYPNKALQEREIAGIYFVSRHGRDLLQNLYASIHTDCLDHQLIWL